MQPSSATEHELDWGNAIFSGGCMYFISLEFPSWRKPSWGSVILLPGSFFTSHYVLNLITFYSHNDSQMEHNNNYRNAWSYWFGQSNSDLLSRDCHGPSQKLEFHWGYRRVWQIVYCLCSLSVLGIILGLSLGLKEFFNIWVNPLICF